MSFSPRMQKGSLDTARSNRHGKITKETVALEGVSVTRVTCGVGAKWSLDLKGCVGTEIANYPMLPLFFPESCML